jgi:hypothetical protein
LQSRTDEELKQIQAQVAAGPSEPQIARALGGYWGSHQFTLTGAAAVDYIFDHKLGQNTFTLDSAGVDRRARTGGDRPGMQRDRPDGGWTIRRLANGDRHAGFTADHERTRERRA